MKSRRNIRNNKKTRKYGGKTPQQNCNNWSRYWKSAQYPECEETMDYPGLVNKLNGKKPTKIETGPDPRIELVEKIKHKQKILQDIKIKIDTIPNPLAVITNLTYMTTKSGGIDSALFFLKNSLKPENNSIISEEINPNDTEEQLEKKYVRIKKLFYTVLQNLKNYTTVNWGKTNPIIDNILFDDKYYGKYLTEIEIIWQKMLKVLANLSQIERLKIHLNLNPHSTTSSISYESRIKDWAKCAGDFRGGNRKLIVILFDGGDNINNKYTQDLLKYANNYKKKLRENPDDEFQRTCLNDDDSYRVEDPLTGKIGDIYQDGGAKTRRVRKTRR